MVLPLIGLIGAGLASAGALGVGSQYLDEWRNRRQASEREGMTDMLRMRGLLGDDGGLLRGPYGGAGPGEMAAWPDGLLGGAAAVPGAGGGDLSDFILANTRGEASSYDTLFGNQERPGGAFEGTRVTDMTIADALRFTDPQGPYAAHVRDQVGRTATPIGRYQIVGSTLRDAAAGLGLPADTRLTPEVQDRLAEEVYRRQGPGAWEAWGDRGPQLATGPGNGRPTYARDMYGGTRPEDLALAAWQTGLIDQLPQTFEGARTVADANDAWSRSLLGEFGANARQEATLAQRDREFGATLAASRKPPEPAFTFSDPAKFAEFADSYTRQGAAIAAADDAIDFLDEYGFGEALPTQQKARLEAELRMSALPVVAQDIMMAGAMTDDERPYFEEMAGGNFATVLGDRKGRAVLESVIRRATEMQRNRWAAAVNSNLVPRGVVGPQVLEVLRNYGIERPTEPRQRVQRRAPETFRQVPEYTPTGN